MGTINEALKLLRESDKEVADTDNRDAETTDLILSDGDKVQINPCELFANAVANSCGDIEEALELAEVINDYLQNEGSDIRITFVDADELDESLTEAKKIIEPEHFPKSKDEFSDYYEEAQEAVLERNPNINGYTMYDAIEYGGWGEESGNFTWEDYQDAYASTQKKGAKELSLEDYIENIYNNVIASGDYDAVVARGEAEEISDMLFAAFDDGQFYNEDQFERKVTELLAPRGYEHEGWYGESDDDEKELMFSRGLSVYYGPEEGTLVNVGSGDDY